MRNRIMAELSVNDAQRAAMIDDAIRSAILYYTGRPYWFLRRLGTVTLLNGNDQVALPADCAKPIAVRLLTNGYYSTQSNGFDYEPDFDAFQAGYRREVVPGQPTAFSLVGNSLITDYLANADYTLEVNYYAKDASPPTADSDTSIWFDDGYDLIRSRATAIYKDESEQYEAAPNDWARADVYERALAARNAMMGIR